MALSARPHPPDGWVRKVLDYADRAREDGQNVQESFTLETLYMGDLDPEDVMWYLWREAQGTDAPQDTWARLQDLLDTTEAELLDYDTMEMLSPPEPTPSAPGPSPEEREDESDTGVWVKA
jgi:hypothetical protein